ncbi:hypothetical protein [Natronosalvus rutilus]|uniref:Uncharacterized protein n=1 Tax=Natronosalvus rutilus TaxID=2953753 RepID=A0A9E7SVL8_9EURY|nr:hypothetical protein [Natronosalvus rutilus]UTF54132.1 hypothetical protein NGM29_02275 [Natronosalvus rutilus]
MKTVEVTDEQYAVIQRLRAAISEDVVGRYGFVRERDAIQFLIDNLEAGEDGEDALDVDFEADTSGRTATDDVAAAVESAIESGSQVDGVEEVSYDEEAETSAADDEGDGDADADSAKPESDGDADTDTGDSSEDDTGGDENPADADTDEADGESAGEDEGEGENEDEDTSENEDEADGDADDENEDEDADDSGGAADDDDMLNKMMNLLDTHDDKWDESPAADYRYRVTLPDDSTEDVQTKDDVRALLFKNY